MTNVVGVLVIMLAIAQLSVGATVRRIKKYVEPVGEVEVANVIKQKKMLEAKITTTRNEWNNIKNKISGFNSEIKANRVKATVISSEVKNLNRLNDRIISLQKDKKERQEKIDDLKNNKEILGEEISGLNTVLSQTPKLADNLQPYQFKLPNPRYPTGYPSLRIKQFDFYCYQGKIHLITADIAELRTEIFSHLKSKFNITNYNKPINCATVVKMFDKNIIKKRHYSVKMNISNGGLEAILSPKPNLNIGENIEQIKMVGSIYQTKLKKLDPEVHYLRFHVAPESYDLYITARKIAIDMQINTGWSPINSKGEVHFKLMNKLVLSCSDQPKISMPKIEKKNAFLGRIFENMKKNIPAEVFFGDLID